MRTPGTRHSLLGDEVVAWLCASHHHTRKHYLAVVELLIGDLRHGMKKMTRETIPPNLPLADREAMRGRAISAEEHLMSLLDLLTQAQDGRGLDELGRQFGLDEEATRSLAEQLAPTIASGAKQKAKEEGGLGTLLGQLLGEREVAYYEEPTKAATPAAQAQGEQFLKDLFGSPEAPHEIAKAAAERTGTAQDLVSQFLPALAAMLQGAMQKQAPDDQVKGAMGALGSNDRPGVGIEDLLGALTGGSGNGAGGGLSDMIGGLLGGGKTQGQASGGLDQLLQSLDADGDGSPFNDIVRKFVGPS